MENVSSSTERHSRFIRNRIVGYFRKFAEKGIDDPAKLDFNDPEVAYANRLHDKWAKLEEAKAEQAGTEEARLLMHLDLATVFVDAGFDGREFLWDTANDWLSQDLWAAEDAGLDEVASQIQDKIDEINAKLAE